MARPALECAVDAWKGLEANPVNMYPWSNGQELDSVRTAAAAMLGCGTGELALTPSTTVSLNMVGEGLVSTGTLVVGDNILTTDSEHGGGLAVWLHWQVCYLSLISFNDSCPA
jgi:selenocysteine lyase/cysteine desulfurase